MRRTLGTLPTRRLLAVFSSVLLLAGCGADAEVQREEEAGSEPAATPTQNPSEDDAPGSVDADLVALVSETAAGGSASSMLTPLDGPRAIEAFLAQFRLKGFAAEVRTAATSTAYDGELWAAVVSVGCDVPPGVSVEESEAGYLVTADEVAEPLEECLAAVTTVALVAIS